MNSIKQNFSFGFVFLFVLMASSLTIAQQTVTGNVTDNLSEPLIGVNIQVKNSSTGTVTDIDGNYSIQVSPSDTLTFSYIGFQNYEVAVGNQSVIDVKLQDDSNVLDEVIVLGYTSVRKSDLTGSVASLRGDQLRRIPVASAADAIKGRMPGVNVFTTDGSPDAEVVIRVRGGGSITQDNSPLYVVDGFIVSSIRDIPPTDIETINVLKDAAATAIYGAQASNGVIVITTKTPQAGKTTVSYNGFIQTKQLPDDRRYEVLSPYEFALANYEFAAVQSQARLENFERFFGAYDDLELYNKKPATDWQEELFGATTTSQYHNFSLSGGTENTKLSLSLTNNNDEGILLGSGFVRNALNFKLNQKLGETLTFEASTRITSTIVDGAGTSGSSQLTIKDAVQTRPVNGIADELEIDPNSIDPNDDFASFIRSLISPTELVEQDWRKRSTNDYIINAALGWSILDNIQAKSTITTSKRFDENLRFYGPLTSESFNNGGNLPLGTKTNNIRDSYRWLNTLSYQLNNNGDYKADFIVGHEIYSNGGTYNFIRAEDFRLSISPEELFANMTFGRTDRLETAELTNFNRVSFFGRANFIYNNKYILTGTVRSDASSRFSAGNRVGIFPAVALGWKISEEDFLKGNSTINELKLRVSYGETGNDRIDATATQFLFQGSTNRGPGFGNFDNAYYTPSESTLYNPDLKWETTINRNLGLDFTLFKGKVSGSLDFYKNTTKDLLLRSAIPSNTGFSTQWNNIGTTSNKGAELGLSAGILERGDFSLNASFNIGINKALIEELDGTDFRFFQSNWASTDLRDRDDYYLEVGGTLGDIYGYVTDGYYTSSDFAGYDDATGRYTLNDGVPDASGTVGNTNIRPGFLKLKDLNSDGIINSEDRQVIGNALPKHQGGFGLDGRWKGFDASVFFNWSYGNDVYNTGKIQFNQFRRVTYGNVLTDMSIDNRYSYLDIDGSITGTPGGIVTDLAQLEQLNSGKNIWALQSFGVAQATIHSWAVEDGSYLRLNNLSIGYSIPTDIISRIGLSQLRVYLTGNNLKLWTNYSG